MKEELRSEYQGVKNAGKIAVLSGGLKTAGQNVFKPKEMVQPYVLRALRQHVLFAFKIPETLMDKDTNRNAADVADFTFMKNAVFPLLRRYEDKMNEKLLPLYDQRLFTKFDNPIPEDRAFKLRETETWLRTGYSTINELREREGLAPVEWGDTPFDVRQMFEYLEGGRDVPTDRTSEEVE
jgi:phage portal protein BeeE